MAELLVSAPIASGKIILLVANVLIRRRPAAINTSSSPEDSPDCLMALHVFCLKNLCHLLVTTTLIMYRLQLGRGLRVKQKKMLLQKNVSQTFLFYFTCNHACPKRIHIFYAEIFAYFFIFLARLRTTSNVATEYFTRNHFLSSSRANFS